MSVGEFGEFGRGIGAGSSLEVTGPVTCRHSERLNARVSVESGGNKRSVGIFHLGALLHRGVCVRTEWWARGDRSVSVTS